MTYEAPDFVKVVTNIKNSFSSSFKCGAQIGINTIVGGYAGSSNIPCGSDTVWTDYTSGGNNNCYFANVTTE